MEQVTLEKTELLSLLTQASKQGALMVYEELALYSLGDACKKLKMSYPTLKRKIENGKIKSIDGKITGKEIIRYLQLNK